MLCAVAVPASAQDVTKTRVTTDIVRDQLAEFGLWLQKLTAAQMIGMQEVEAMQGEWARANRAPDARAAAAQFRPVIVRTKLKIDQSDAALRALDTPTFPALELSAEFQPAALVAQMIEHNGHVRTLAESFNPLLDAMIANDMAAVQRAGTSMMRAAKLLLDSQAVLAGATAAANEPGSSTYHALVFQQLFFQSNSRIADAVGVVMTGGRDTRLAADIRGFADRIDAIARDGIASIEAEKRAYAEEIVAATDDPHELAILRGSLEIAEIERRTFALARRYGADLRSRAAGLPAAGASLTHLVSWAQMLRPAREEIDAIAIAQNEVLTRLK